MNLIRYWRRIDSSLLMTVLGLAVVSLLIIASATHANVPGHPGQFDFVIKQGVFLLLGLAVAGGSLYFDYRGTAPGRASFLWRGLWRCLPF